MEQAKTYLILIFGIVIVSMFLMKGCKYPIPDIEVKPQIVEHYKTDTVFSKDTIVKLKPIIKFKTDTIYKLDTIKENVKLEDLYYVRVYNDSIVDDYQSIYYKAKTLGMLRNLSLSYKVKKHPVLITNTDSIFITKTQPVRFSIYSGLILDGNKSSINLSPFVTFNKDNLSYTAKYGILDKTIGIGVGYKLYSKQY